MYVRLLLGLLCVLGCATLADASPFAYVANYNGNSVTRIDLSKTTDNTMVIPLPGSAGPYGVAVNTFGSRVYVSSKLGYIVSVIDTSDNTVSSITLPFKPGALAVNSAGTRLYVADPEHDSLAVVDAVTGTLLKTVTVGTSPSMESPAGVAVSGSKVYVSSSPRINRGTEAAPILKDAIHIFDTDLDSMNHLASVDVDLLPMGLALNSAGDRLYVACNASDKVNAINLSVTPPTVTVIPASGSGVFINDPVGIALSGDGSKAYVTLAGEDNVAVINTATNAVNAQRIAVGHSPMGISITPGDTRIVTANSNAASASVINPATNTVVATSTVGDAPQSLGNFAGPELFPVTFPYPFNGTVAPGVPITVDPYSLIALAPKGYNLPLNVQPDTNFVVGSVMDGTTVLNPPYTLANVVGPRTITATFTRVARNVIVEKTGKGTGRVWSVTPASPYIDCGTTCTNVEVTYLMSDVVSLYAQADPGSTFQGWGGALCTGYDLCRIDIDGNKYYDPISGNFIITAPFGKLSVNSLQDAYDNASNGGTITCEATYSSEPATSFNAGIAKTVTLIPAAANTTLTLPTEHKLFTVQYGQIIIGGTTGGAFIIQ